MYHYRFVATNAPGRRRAPTECSRPRAGAGRRHRLRNGVTPTSATLTGTVDPNGRTTTWYFEYGTSTSYGTKTPAPTAGSGTAATGVSAPVSGLDTGRLYHFRLVAASDAGTSRGADRTFSTPATRRADTVAAVLGLPELRALNGTVDPNGQATTWHFEYGTSLGYGSTTPQERRNRTNDTNVSTFAHTPERRTRPTTSAWPQLTPPGRPSAATRRSSRSRRLRRRDRGRAGRRLHDRHADRRRLPTRAAAATSWYFEYGASTRYGSRSSTLTRLDSAAGRRFSVSVGVSRPRASPAQVPLPPGRDEQRGNDPGAPTPPSEPPERASPSHLLRPVAVYGRAVTLAGPRRRQRRRAVAVLAQSFGDAPTSGRSRPCRRAPTASGRWSYASPADHPHLLQS